MRVHSLRFEGLLDRYFESYLEDHPAFAVMIAGVPSAEGKLGRAHAEFHERREKSRRRTLRELDAISPRELSREQHLDRLALRAQILADMEDYDRGRHRLEPSAPEQILNLYLHELLRFDDEPGRAAANLRRLLKQTPGFLEEAAAVLISPERVWLKIMAQAVAGAPLLVSAIELVLARQDPQPSDAPDAAAAQRAFQAYHDHAADLPLAPPQSFALGAEALQRRVRDELGLDYSLGEVEALAEAEVARVSALIRESSRKLGRGRGSQELLAEARANWRPDRPLLDLYEEETRRIAAAFRASKAIPFPEGDELRLKQVPDFLQNLIPTAAYNQPGAFEKKQRGVFWVNDLSIKKNNPAEKLAEQQQHFGISLTCAHEAYPGHHLQFVTANRHPRRWRRLFAHAVFYEGWTLWCEQMMIDLKIERSPWLKVQQLHDALWRCHRILVDLRLQTGRYSYVQAVNHMQKHLGFTKARAEADVNWYTGKPAVPMSYWLGRLENARLHDRLVRGRGWSLLQFNSWLLSFGTLPQAWLEKYVLD